MMPDYYVHSGVRKRHTRIKRMSAPVHAAMVQHIGGLIVRRVRPVKITAQKLAEILPQLKLAWAEGRLELRTQDGRLVDLDRFEPIDRPTASPPPNPRLDSAANDAPAGQPMSPYYEGTGVTQTIERPVILPEQDTDSIESDRFEPDDEAAGDLVAHDPEPRSRR